MEFTNEEKHRIDVLYGNDFNGEITPDDIRLIQRFEQHKAENNALINAEIELMQSETNDRIEQNHETAAMAREALKARADRSKARWEKVRYGQEE